MKSLLEKLKAVPKKTLIITGLLIILSVSTLMMSVIVVKQAADRHDVNSGGDDDSLGVFNDGGSSQKPSDKEPELDMTDVYGLKFVSRGDGTCYVGGIGTCQKTELEIPSVSPSGDKVTGIGERAFENCKELLSIYIPASVTTVGTGAFRGCEKLVAINVSTENTVYCSVGGILFSKDKTVLLCYPMNRAGANYLLSTDIKAIGAYAFEGAINLRGLLFSGSVSDFNKIDILTGNDILNSITITCNYSGAK